MEKIVEELKTLQGISGWKVTEIASSGIQAFWAGRDEGMVREMARAVDSVRWLITLFVDFTEGERRETGSYSLELTPASSREEIRSRLATAVVSCGFAKNPWYPLGGSRHEGVTASLLKGWDDPSTLFGDLTGRILDAVSAARSDFGPSAHIDQIELFVDRSRVRFLNSGGISHEEERGVITFDVISSWVEGEADVELYFTREFRDPALFDPEAIIRTELASARDRSRATDLPVCSDIPVVFSAEHAAMILRWFESQTHADFVYRKISTARTGSAIAPVGGDPVSIRLVPVADHAADSATFDGDGTALTVMSVVENGIMTACPGGVQFSYYMGLPPTGVPANMYVDTGSLTRKALEGREYLELRSFSDFQVSPVDGEFAGEIRLGYLHSADGSITIVSGGSVSGCVPKLKSLLLSDARTQLAGYDGPEFLLVEGAVIAGG